VISYGDLPTISGNKTQIYQLFQNLINNALKYQAADSSPEINIDVVEGGRHWIFSIQDNGIGIAPEHRYKIFEVFQRLHRRTQYPGTGIGLAICKKIVERHGGEIWVESQKGMGSTFYFKLLKSTPKETLNG
jgi:signal transduction histidine kinase